MFVVCTKMFVFLIPFNLTFLDKFSYEEIIFQTIGNDV